MKRILCLALSLLLLALTGCAKENNFSWKAITAPTAVPTPAPDARERALRLSMPEESGRLNPLDNSSQAMQRIMRLMFEPLVGLDSAGKPVPYLAESWVTSEDGSTWTFTLRKNIFFHDGSALTALDVSKSLDAIIAAGSKSPWADSIGGLISWSAQDDRTLIVRTRESGYAMLYCMTFPVVHALGESAVVGTGPYKVEEYVQGASLTLRAQDSWWKKAPNITEISITARPSNESELAAIELGALDLVFTQSLTASLYREKGIRRTQDYYTQTYDLLAFNFDNPVLADATVRQAISMAIDREDIVTNIYQNHAVVCEVPISPDNWLHSSSLEQRDANPEAARALLSGIGFLDTDGDGLFDLLPERLRLSVAEKQMEKSAASNAPTPTPAPVLDPSLIPPTAQTPEPQDFADAVQEAEKPFTMRLLTNYDLDSPTRLDAANRIARQLERLGLVIEVESVPFDSLAQKIAEGNYDLLLVGYKIPSSGDLRFLLDSGRTQGQSGVLVTHYVDEQMDALLVAAEEAKTDMEYQKALGDVQRRFVERMPFIGLYFRSGTMIINQELTLSGVVHSSNPFRDVDEWSFAP